MRSALVALLIFVWMPVMLFKPHIGVLVWNWVSHMNPHAYTYGFAQSFPFLVLVGGLTAAGLVIAREPKRFPFEHPIMIALLTYVLWTIVTYIFAFNHTVGEPKIIQFMKMIAFALVSVMVMQSPNRLKGFFYVMVVSLLFIAIKGGAFTLLTGGGNRVQGAGGMMGDNNQLSMAMAMLFPLSLYFVKHPPHRLFKWPAIGAATLVPFAAIGTQSRGGFVALAAVLFMFLMKSRRRFLLLAIAIPLAIGAVNFMPESWMDRMQSTENATDDDSFLGRVGMWKFSTNVAADHPIVGGGFNVFYYRALSDEYMPFGYRMKAPHSIYYEVLGEHGYFGLFFFLTLLFVGWFAAGTTAKMFRQYKETEWIGDMAGGVQLSFLAYAVGGITVNIAAFDFFYHLLITVILCRVVGDRMVEKGVTKIEKKSIINTGPKEKWRPGAPPARPQPAE
ncbi:MAG: putative O-glycosylation ligase, exosortase A system-associated [Kordiimonadaceae bacterium]|nr:putative O-glycosylation ligase, exosortase A system-associated [Kordiimonadaceae bacterium]MBO6567978.1 putative O-glycosylation ligase, exosortase A system-associated [Kordiimonadaceae bacterium]MBO6964292.1 putative O-glycosylation ligase, exosortase A system-associated [Kordiimonadaceae bacterium]